MNRKDLSDLSPGARAMRKFWRAAAFTAFFLFISLYPGPAPAAEELQVSALAAVLMDRDSGRILWEKKPHLRLPIASTTKIMTALLALEEGCEDDPVVVSPEAAATEGSSIWLDAGEKKTLGELIYGLMLRSGNDAAAAIAEHLGGSEDDFVAMMNEKAAALGANDTLYSNPHGLPDGPHYSTAHDLGLITRRALQNERFREIVSTPEHAISWPGRPWNRAMNNQNRLLELYPGGDGVKTGWTIAAGRCLVGSATRGGWQLLCVVLNAPQMWDDAAALLDYGFDRYRRRKIFHRGQVLCTAPVHKGCSRVGAALKEDLYLPLQPGEEEALHCRISLGEGISAPLPAGEKIGEVEILLEGRIIEHAALYSGCAVGRKGIFSYLSDILASLLCREMGS